ncbi:MAG: TPM domain-containing protein [Lachnospiraceae bacterium]|nr:TPM domain-containing protein [Lachnospiraceae bacterium]
MAQKKNTNKNIKTNKDSILKKIKKAPSVAWILAVVISIVIMAGPILVDVLNEVGNKSMDENTSIVAEERIIVRDEADLLTPEGEAAIKEHMVPITKYGSVALVTTRQSSMSSSDYATKRYMELIGKTSGTLFLIDMGKRQLYIYSGGRLYDTVSASKAETITDNVYTYASRGLYYECAASVFDQISTILEGGIIPQPMKHISNALLALAIALMVVFVIANFRTRIRKAAEKNVFDETATKSFEVGNPASMVKIYEKKTRHTESSGGGGGGYSGGGGGGGGGGFSGGGGGHGF